MLIVSPPGSSSESEAEEEEEEDRDMDTSSEEEDTTMATTRPSLHVVGGFQWDKGEKEEAPEGGSSSESDEEKEEVCSWINLLFQCSTCA